MRKATIIALAVFASSFSFSSCSNANTASSAYFGVSDKKGARKRQKEFQKPKYKLAKVKCKEKN